jgi:hypothetical protein
MVDSASLACDSECITLLEAVPPSFPASSGLMPVPPSLAALSLLYLYLYLFLRCPCRSFKPVESSGPSADLRNLLREDSAAELAEATAAAAATLIEREASEPHLHPPPAAADKPSPDKQQPDKAQEAAKAHANGDAAAGQSQQQQQQLEPPDAAAQPRDSSKKAGSVFDRLQAGFANRAGATADADNTAGKDTPQAAAAGAERGRTRSSSRGGSRSRSRSPGSKQQGAGDRCDTGGEENEDDEVLSLGEDEGDREGEGRGDGSPDGRSSKHRSKKEKKERKKAKKHKKHKKRRHEDKGGRNAWRRCPVEHWVSAWLTATCTTG